MDELAIKVNDVKKKYKLGAIGGSTLTEELQTKWALKHGKKDPNAMVGLDPKYKGQKEFWALKGVSFEVRKGEALGIIGFNGAGKSTLLKILSHITAPTEGEVRIKGKITSMLEVGTGFHGELTGRENIYLNGAILGMSKAEVDSKIDDIIEFSECGEFIDTPVKRYSSGMYVKLAFSVASHLDSEIMIMDEVLAVGDVKFQQKCLKKMKELVDTEGRTLLFVSHNMSTIRQLCTRSIVLNRGEIIYQGDVEEGIDLYLAQDAINGTIKKDLRNCRRPNNSLNEIQMLSCEILEKKDNRFHRDEDLHANIKFKSLTTRKGVFIRLMVKAHGARVASIISSQKYDISLGQYEINIQVPLIELVPGNYSVDIAFFIENEAHESVILDHVYEAIELIVVSEDNDLKWEDKWWGNIRLRDFSSQMMIIR